MKHLVPILLFVLAVSCSKSEGGSGSTPIVDFSTSTNTIYMGGNVVIPIVLSSPAEKECSVGLKFEGTATKGTDYSVSAESVSFAAGKISAASSGVTLFLLFRKKSTSYSGSTRKKAIISGISP